MVRGLETRQEEGGDEGGVRHRLRGREIWGVKT